MRAKKHVRNKTMKTESKVHCVIRKEQMKFSIVPKRAARGGARSASRRGEGDGAMFSCLWVVGARLSNSNASPAAPTRYTTIPST